MEQQLLLLTQLADQFNNIQINNIPKHDEIEAVQGLLKFQATEIKPTPIYIDPIIKLKAAHSLRQNRERLHVFLSYSLTMEEFKSKFSPPDYYDENEASLSKERMVKFAKKRAALYSLFKPKNIIYTQKSIVKKDRKVNILPFPQRQNRRNSRSCLNENFIAAC